MHDRYEYSGHPTGKIYEPVSEHGATLRFTDAPPT